MGRKVFLATSPEPQGVAVAISKCFDVALDRVTYDGELQPYSGYLFTVDVPDADTETVCKKLRYALDKLGFDTNDVQRPHVSGEGF